MAAHVTADMEKIIVGYGIGRLEDCYFRGSDELFVFFFRHIGMGDILYGKVDAVGMTVRNDCFGQSGNIFRED